MLLDLPINVLLGVLLELLMGGSGGGLVRGVVSLRGRPIDRGDVDGEADGETIYSGGELDHVGADVGASFISNVVA